MQAATDKTLHRSNPDTLRPLAATVPPPRAGASSHAASPVAPPRPRLTSKLLVVIGAGAVAAATIAASPYASEPDTRSVAAPELKRVDSGDLTRWHLHTVEVTLDPSLEALGPEGLDAVRGAYGTWLAADANLPKARFELAKNKKLKPKQDGENRVIAAPIAIPGHEHDLAITVSYVSPSGAILESDIVINTNHTFHVQDGPSCSKRFDLRSVITHEVGHFYGLGEDWDDRETTMYFETPACQTSKRSLSDPDVETLAYLYDAALAEAPEPGVGCSVAAPGPALPAFPWVVGALLALGLASRRRTRA